MKLKNISIGDFIEAKNKHGGDVGFDVLEIGKSYEVMGFNEDSDLTVIISVPEHKTFRDGFYVCHECFRKPKQNSLIERDIAKELLEVDLSSELTGSDLARAMLARGDKYVSGFGHHQSDDGAVYSTFADTVTRYSHCFHSAQNSWDYFVPINNQGEPLTASEVGL
ncbi:hypothetical protein [Psychrobacter glacincola]|uniref:hypothetical protein n=1 Tax=Psychrobacter glacincola TaxID=56810 RepID=UPI0039AF2F92